MAFDLSVTLSQACNKLATTVQITPLFRFIVYAQKTLWAHKGKQHGFLLFHQLQM